MDLKFQVYVKIRKPVDEVFDAVYNPEKLSKYFTTGGAKGTMDRDATVTWDFADFPGSFPVYVKESNKNELIVFQWGAMDGDYNTTVEINFTSIDPHTTKVQITEYGWKETQAGLDASYGNCFGWTQMLCALKIYLELNMNLREFFF